MSTLVTNTITGLSTAANITIGSTPVVSASANSLTIRGEGSAQTSVQQGLAKCWVIVQELLAAIMSFNVAVIQMRYMEQCNIHTIYMVNAMIQANNCRWNCNCT